MLEIWKLLKMLPWILILKITAVVVVVALIALCIGSIVMYIWVKVRQGTDYDYNIFQNERVTKVDKRFGAIKFSVPRKLKEKVNHITTKNKNRDTVQQVRIEQNPGEFIGEYLPSVFIKSFLTPNSTAIEHLPRESAHKCIF